MKKIRILHCIETLGSGGVEQLKLLKVINLDSKRYSQAILCTKAIGGLPEKFLNAGCEIYEIGVFRGIFDVQRYSSALKIVRKFQPDIIHGAVYEGVAIATIVGKLSRVKVIIGEETSDPVNRSWRGHLLYRVLTTLTDKMIAVSPAVESYLINKIKVPSKNVLTINNGVANTKQTCLIETNKLKEKLNIDKNDLVIGTCGRLFDQHKKFSDLIIAFGLIRNKQNKIKLIIVGEGPDEHYLRALAIKLNLENEIIFVGYQSETRPFYDLMDIFALVSAHEAFGLVLVEAMLASLPIIATSVGGIPFIVRDNYTGFLVEPNNPQSIADGLSKLIQNMPLRKNMGLNGLERAKKLFSAERYVKEFDSLYSSFCPK